MEKRLGASHKRNYDQNMFLNFPTMVGCLDTVWYYLFKYKFFLSTFRGVLINAKCEKCESHEQPTTLTSIFLNLSIWSLNDTNSVGQTNVLEKFQKQLIFV